MIRHLAVALALFISIPAFAEQSPRSFPDCAELLVSAAHFPADPAHLYGELFHQVQTSGLFSDSKFFVDMEPRYSPATIMARYARLKPKTTQDLRQFVEAHFFPPSQIDLRAFKIRSGLTAGEYIRELWPSLTRESHLIQAGSSLIPLKGKHILPGGRFREIYYWDSYFTMLGLQQDGQDEVFDRMVLIFKDMLLKDGMIRNGNRSYYNGRSQPPFFAMMVALWQWRHGTESATQFLPALKTEYAYWMAGQSSLKPGEGRRRVVSLETGGFLNRFWSDSEGPRSEAYKEDLELAHRAALEQGRAAEEVFKDLAAGAESGWDYSSRWFADPSRFTTIQTTSLLPVDLNSMLWFLEKKIAELSAAVGDRASSQAFEGAARKRKSLMVKYLWDETSGEFRDFNWKTGVRSTQSTIATAVPLFVGLATPLQAQRIAHLIDKDFMRSGGVRTTLLNTDQQWDGDNGWAPLQWMTFAGLKRYQKDVLAERLRKAWLKTNDDMFTASGEMKEKYNVVNSRQAATGGEYEPQFGFGWSNGVYKAFSSPETSLEHLFSRK